MGGKMNEALDRGMWFVEKLMKIWHGDQEQWVLKAIHGTLDEMKGGEMDKDKEYRDKRRKEKPWEYSYYSAHKRCTNPNSNRYKYYGARGIQFRLTMAEYEFLWHRDKAEEMERPSIDRINNDGHYELNNCRFIELAENTRRAQTSQPEEKDLGYIGPTKEIPDPIRAVYEKYFNNRDKYLESGTFNKDMWNAIKQYCEGDKE